MIKCKGCGADIPFIPETQNYICPYCDTVHTHEELTAMEQAGEIIAEEHELPPEQEPETNANQMHVYVYTCPQCGGELLTTEETYATFCSYCGSSVLLSMKEDVEEKPDYIIPFKISKEQAANIYKEKLRKAFFAPNYVKHMDIEKVRGIYMPYWTYDGEIKGTASGKSVTRTRKHGGTQVDTYQSTADVVISGDGLEYDSSLSFPDDLSQAAGPFHFKNAKPFAASFMSGFYADKGTVAQEAYEADALDTLLAIGREDVSAKLGIGEGALDFNVRKFIRADKAMYPIWFICARNKEAKKVSYAVINGESGKIAADVPIDPKKLLVGTFLIAIPVFLILYLLLVPTPRVTALVTVLMALIGIIITGISSFRTKLKFRFSIVLNVLALIICLGLSLVNPFQDEIYYAGIGLSDILCILSYLIIFGKHNRNMLRALPQLGKRGGDEDA